MKQTKNIQNILNQIISASKIISKSAIPNQFDMDGFPLQCYSECSALMELWRNGRGGEGIIR